MIELDVTKTWHDGQQFTVILPVVAEDAAPLIREGIARRRLTTLHGQCPCGARLTLPGRAQRRAAQRAGRVLRATVEHEDDCPALLVAGARA